MTPLLASLPNIERVFRKFQKASNLALNPKKSILIPLGGFFSPALAQQYADFLALNVPSWRDFGIAPFGVYLGFAIGPGAAAALWGKAVAKWSARALAIGAARVAPSLGVKLYNTRAVPTLGYIAQLCPLARQI